MTWKWIERFWCSVAGVVNDICAPREKGVDTLSYLVYLMYMPAEAGC